jgi:MerR family transcriptional regulator, repressor of the yfmOP operon
MSATAGQPQAARPAEHPGAAPAEQLLGIGAAAQRAGVSQRALRYYQQIGLLTPCGCTPGGLRRYSEEDLARVARIRQLQELLGLDLDAISRVLHDEDRRAQIRRAYQDEGTSQQERQELLRESLDLQQRLRAIVETKLRGIAGFLADLDARISKTRALLDQSPEPVGAGPPHARNQRS